MTYVIGEPCVDVLDRAREPVCPVEAIYYEDDCRISGRSTRRRTPGSSPIRCLAATSRSARRAAPAKLGVAGADTPFVTALPPREEPGGETVSDGAARPVLFEAGRDAAEPEEAAMMVIIYGDFN